MNARNDNWLRFGVKPGIFLACLIPFALLAKGAVEGDLGANPLAMTPLRQLTGWALWLRFRRMLGLFAFFYATLHFMTWVWLDQELLWANIVVDIAKRPYVTVGFTAWLLLVPLALTSTRGMMRRLGRRWKSLHRAVYAVGALGVLHYLWLVKADLLEPLIYLGLLAVLLLARWRPDLLKTPIWRQRIINVR